jgi:hypothetical protein
MFTLTTLGSAFRAACAKAAFALSQWLAMPALRVEAGMITRTPAAPT